MSALNSLIPVALPQKRLAKIQQAMAALEADTRLAAAEERRIEAEKERRRRLRNTLPIEKASGGTCVRTDQTGARLPPVPVAGYRKSACRVGHDLHRPQPPEAVHPRKGRLRRLL